MNTIVVNGMGTKVKVLLDNTNFVSEHTLRAAFQLEKDVPIGLFMTIDGEKIFLRYFSLLKFKVFNILYNLVKKRSSKTNFIFSCLKDGKLLNSG